MQLSQHRRGGLRGRRASAEIRGPEAAGQGIANPLAMFLSVALLLRHGLDLADAAAAVESAVDKALDQGLRTRDLGGTASTAEAANAVLAHLEESST